MGPYVLVAILGALSGTLGTVVVFMLRATRRHGEEGLAVMLLTQLVEQTRPRLRGPRAPRLVVAKGNQASARLEKGRRR